MLEYLIPNSYYMQLVWAKYLSLYKGNDCCRTKSFILLVERFLYFLFRFYYLSLLWEKIFYISLTSPAAVSCFCTKLFGICTKQNIFCTKDGGNSCMFFQNLPYFFYSDSGFFGGVPCLFEWKSPVFSFTYPFFKSVFYLVGYDSLVSFPSVCLFLRILLIKNLFFQNEPSFRKCIFSLFVWVFSYFFRCFGRFFCPASHPFLHFSFRLRKICCFFHPDHPFSEIFSLRRNNFSCLFYVELRKFSVCFHNFFAFSELFQKKNLLFFVSVIGFSGMSFLTIRIFFKFFSWGNWEIFLPVFIIFALFPGLFKGKILIFRNEFSVRTNIFSLPRGVFPDFFRVIR